MNKNGKLIAVIISLVVVIVGVATFYMLQNKDDKKSLSNNNSTKNREVEITDTCEEGLSFPDAMETYYEDENYACSFNQIKSGCYTVKVDGKEYSLKDALNNKVITVEEAIEEGLYCTKKTTDSEDKSNSNPSNTVSNSNIVSNSNTNSQSNTNTTINTNTNVSKPSNTNSNSTSNIISNSNKPTNSNSNITSSGNISTNIISNSNVQGTRKISVVSKCGPNTTQQLDFFYEDNEYQYYFNSGQSSCTYVIVNGKEYSLRSALNGKIVTMEELEKVGFRCMKKSKNLVDR